MRPALLLCVPAAAQTTGGQPAGERAAPEPLLSGTTLGLPWGLYAGGLTSLADLAQGEARLHLSAPEGARVLGTRYDPRTGGALLVYRSPLSVRDALAFAVDQLQRQGFDVTSRSFATPGEARALLRRTGRLIEVRITGGTQDVIHALYLFRSGDQPGRLLVNDVPESVIVYAAPVNLRAVQVQPGRVILTPPADVLIDRASQSGGETTLLFSGTFTLAELEKFYHDLFVGQGFAETGKENPGPNRKVLRYARGAERVTLTLDTSPAPDQTRVAMRYQP